MSNYLLHLPEHTWNDLAITEKQPTSRKYYRINAPPARQKVIRSTKTKPATTTC